MIIPVVITVYNDRSFSFITKTPPAAVLIKKACKIQSGSGVPNKNKGCYDHKRLSFREIAETKMPDLKCCKRIEAAMSMIAGTCRSMGVVVERAWSFGKQFVREISEGSESRLSERKPVGGASLTRQYHKEVIVE